MLVSAWDCPSPERWSDASGLFAVASAAPLLPFRFCTRDSARARSRSRNTTRRARRVASASRSPTGRRETPRCREGRQVAWRNTREHPPDEAWLNPPHATGVYVSHTYVTHPERRIEEGKRGVPGPLLGRSPRYGYEIAQSIEQRSEGAVTFHAASLYPPWYWLESRSIAGRWTERAGERRRRLYRLTAAGRQVLAARRSGWETFVRAINRITREHAERRPRFAQLAALSLSAEREMEIVEVLVSAPRRLGSSARVGRPDRRGGGRSRSTRVGDDGGTLARAIS